MKVRKSTKKQSPPSPDVVSLVKAITTASDDELPAVLKSFDSWVYLRGDLHTWVDVLDRFDDILADIVKSYDLSKIQVKDFTPETKELLMEILRVQRLLLENCTNRRLFASYDRLCDLLFTSDLDVLQAAIYVLLRPAQQYANQTPFESTRRHAILHRLLTLSRGWERLTNAGFDLVSITSRQITLPEDLTTVSIQYYPVSEPSSSTPRRTSGGTGPSTLDLETVSSWSSSTDRLTASAEEHHISLEDQYVALNKIRLANLRDLPTQRQLLTVRLLALATYIFISNEDAAQSALFLYEPELVSQLADLVRGSNDDTVTASAILALDACSHHRAKSSEVMTAVCANVNHGILVTRFRRIVETLVKGDHVPSELFDAAIAFIAYITTSLVHSNMLVGAGILRLLIDMLSTTSDGRDSFIPRATGLLDTFVFSNPQALSNFSSIDGVNTLVHRVKTEIDRRIAASDPAATERVSHDSMINLVNNPLRSVLRSLQRLMSASGGTEGLRNLVDSDLPKCLKRIFEEPSLFGPRVYAIAITTMAAFVHNEPTSLSILQELQLPQALYSQLERDLPASYEVIGTITNAIGAICLNQTGLDYTTSHAGVLINLVNVMASPAYEHLFNDRDSARHFGASLDELSRHQPSLRPVIMKAIMDLLQRVTEAGSKFEPPLEDRRDYILDEMTQTDNATTRPVPSNPHLTTFARVFKVLSGLVRNAATSKDFVKEGGLDYVLGLAELPCLPIRFGPTDAATAIASLLKHVGEHNHAELIETIITSIQKSVLPCQELFEDDSQWTAMNDRTASEQTRSAFQSLRALAVRLSFLAEVQFALALSHSRLATSLIQAVNKDDFISELGKMHRMAFRQHVLLKRKPEQDPVHPSNAAEDFARDTGAKYLATKVHSILNKFFRSTIKLIFVKRNPDTAHIKQATALAEAISAVTIGHLEVPDTHVMSLGVATSFLFDARGAEGHLNSTLFFVFLSKGGLHALLSSCQKIVDSMDGSPDATAGVKAVLSLLSGLASPRSLPDNPETHALQQRLVNPLKQTTDIFVEIRLLIFPLVHEIWKAQWLVDCPSPIIKLAMRCFATLIEGKNEQASSEEGPSASDAAIPAVRPPPPIVADPTRVDLLVDMGFARGVAERALLRARNNVAAATELILSMPHMFQDAPEPPAQPEEPAAASQEQPEQEDVPEEPRVPSPPPPLTAPETSPASREMLRNLREEYRQDMSSRALVLLDHAEELVHDALPCFPTGSEGVTYMIDRLDEVTRPVYDPSQETPISTRLRLISVYLRTAEEALSEDNIVKAAAIISALPLETTPRPKWFSALLLFAETAFASSFNVTKVKIGDESVDVTVPSAALGAISLSLASACFGLISTDGCTRDDLIASLRLLVLLTRHCSPTTEQVAQLLKVFKTASDKLSGCHPLLLLIIRHTFEDTNTLTETMRREIRHWLSPSRSKVVDIQYFTRQLRQAALRDPTCFVQAVEDECTLVNPTPPQSVYHIRSKNVDIPTSSPSSDPFQDDADDKRQHPLIDHLVSELGESVRASLADDSEEAHTYAGLLMSILCELLGSYTSTKKAFVASTRDNRLGTKTKGGVSSLVADLVCCVILSPDITGVPAFEKNSKPAHRLAVSSWASSLLLSLCADTTPQSTVKDVSEDLITIRKTVLDAVAKTLRDTATVVELPIRYGRLWALGELIHRMLIARPTGPRQQTESSLNIAKIMLEKNFVGLLTNALGDIDINYPDVRNVLVTLLRALEHLSKMSVKYGKANRETKDRAKAEAHDEESSSSDSESDSDSDIDMIEDDSAPDLYRNSALGMIGGELGDDDEEDDDEDDEDDEMDMGDDLTDDEGGTELDTSEDDSMGSELDPDNWTDDMGDEGSEGEELEREVILGSNGDEEDEIWEDAEDDQESLLTDENEMDDEEADDIGDHEGFFDEDQPELEMDEGEEFDEMDIFEALPATAQSSNMLRQSADITGPWGWQGPTQSSRSQGHRPRSILAEDSATSLFGHPPASQGTVAQHPLISEPSANRSSSLRNLSRSFGNNLNEILATIEGLGGPEAARMLQSVITNRQLAGSDALRIEFAQDESGHIGLTFDGRTVSIHTRHQSQTPAADILSEFAPCPTMERWQEEMNLATTCRNELVSRLVLHITNRLMPEARRRAAEEEAEAKKAEEEEARKLEQEKVKQLESATTVALPESLPASPELAADPDVPMPEAEADVPMGSGATEESLARTIISIHGRDVDITDTGIDLEFLQALPDDMRADVVEQHMREQARHQRPANPSSVPESASQINPEFLDALPPEIRAEVIMHEAIENARRSEPAPNRGASFLASLTNELRDVMMMNAPGETAADAVVEGLDGPGPSTSPAEKKPQREAIQLLEKPGIASLVRLLFFPETLKKGHLFRVLVNLCENSTTRTDLLNLLLSVVQDGSGDLLAVDRSFQHLSLRGVVTPKATSKTRVADSPAAAVVPFGLFNHLQTEHVPTFIAQRCFEALAYIVNSNAAAVTYFLTEHEQPIGLRKLAKKGKGKDKLIPQTKFPVVVLLGLLDRPLLAKTPGMMETVTALLVTITKPLAEASDDALRPSIPPQVLRLIVNCLTTGECTSRTFSQTLVAMQNLTSLPEAKEVILQELKARCRDLGKVTHGQLTELATALEDETAEIGSLTLANFAPPTSTQAQLLRLLKTIDYLHLNKIDSEPPTSRMTDEESAVSAIFESFDFGPLWSELGRCLSRVEARESTDPIATILLPLVEALMVICKYRSRVSREVRSPSVSPASEFDLFVSFTTTHRKVLNTIVRNNPSLLGGSFSLLIRNPRVLEFDNKRNWFFQKLKRKRDQPMSSNVLNLNIRRQYVFEDSFRALQRRGGDEIKYGKLNVKFYNEDGVDAGGVTREWYSVLAQQIFDPNFALFEPCAADQQTYQPNKFSSVNGDHLDYFKFVGRVIGKAVYDGRLLDAYFNRAFYKQILGRTVDMRDLESIDPEYHKSLQWMLDNDITGVIDQEFTIEDDQFGEKKIVELKPGGASVPVTEENKEEYVRLVVSYRLDNSIKDQIKAFLDGFYDIIPRQLIQIFEPDQLELLISGITTVDVDELKNATQMSGWKTSDPEIAWFWRALRSFSQEERSRFLMFVTSSSRVPLGGFAQLQGSSGTQPFQIQKLYSKEGSLPQASTCFNLLLLPSYASYEQLRDRLQFAMMETGGFGKA